MKIFKKIIGMSLMSILIFTLASCGDIDDTSSTLYESHESDESDDAETAENYDKYEHGAAGYSEKSNYEEKYTNETTAPETSTTGSISIGQRNALKQAKKYLDVMPFSYSGLVKQLEYEGYSNEEAVYAVDNCGANWNEQAAKQAEKYLDVMSFSRSGLIEQLEYEGFTHDQAVYGVTAVGY